MMTLIALWAGLTVAPPPPPPPPVLCTPEAHPAYSRKPVRCIIA